jgi:AcrR family transcriptional regulator
MAVAERNPDDPRIRRTRLLIQDAFVRLLKAKNFDKISVQDISEEATINRATFYLHYTDKYALFECVAVSRFWAFMKQRGVEFNNGCPASLKVIISSVCEFLTMTHDTQCEKHRHIQPHMETALIAVLRQMLLEGLKIPPPVGQPSPEIVAATASSAIFGAAKEWASTRNRKPVEQIVEMVDGLVSPLLSADVKKSRK